MWSVEGGPGCALDHLCPPRFPLPSLRPQGCGHLAVNHERGEADLLPGTHAVAMGNPGRGPAGTGELGTRAARGGLARSAGSDVFSARSWLEPRAVEVRKLR